MTKQADSMKTKTPKGAAENDNTSEAPRRRRKAKIREQVIQQNQHGVFRTMTVGNPASVAAGMNLSSMTFGVDIGDKKSNYCLLDP